MDCGQTPQSLQSDSERRPLLHDVCFNAISSFYHICFDSKLSACESFHILSQKFHKVWCATDWWKWCHMGIQPKRHGKYSIDGCFLLHVFRCSYCNRKLGWVNSKCICHCCDKHDNPSSI